VGAASLCKGSQADKTATVIGKIFQIVLWLAAAACAVVGVLAITGMLGSAAKRIRCAMPTLYSAP
jgi:hypothetical protein